MILSVDVSSHERTTDDGAFMGCPTSHVDRGTNKVYYHHVFDYFKNMITFSTNEKVKNR